MKREEIPQQYKWKMEDLYVTNEAWETDFKWSGAVKTATFENAVPLIYENAQYNFMSVVGVALTGDGTSSATTVIAFMQYFTLISMAMMSISRMFVMYTKCAASAKRISEVITTKNELEAIPDDGLGSKEFHIEFENVSFSYLHKKDNLKNISFAIKKGESLGIIGATGSGKSTIIKLLMRFYDANSGIIRINGRDTTAGRTEFFACQTVFF